MGLARNLTMQYQDLNPHFKEKIRERVHRKLTGEHPGQPVDRGIRDYLVGIIILLADENNLVRAAERLYEVKQANRETACTLESAIETAANVYERFGTEVSILHDLYQLQEQHHADIMDIIAHMEVRLLEP